MKWWCNFWSIEDMTVWWVFKIFSRTHTFWWKNFSDHKNSCIPWWFGVNEVNVWKYGFWQFSEKLVGDKKYLIVSDQKSFGKRFDHFNHPENILQPYSHHQTFFSQLESRSWKFLFGVYVIFMEFFEVNKSLQCIVQGIRHVILHQINELWLVRTHTWKNSSIFWMLKMPNFT